MDRPSAQRTSNVIAGADYDETSQTLTLHFQSGTTYTYANVPQRIYHDLMLADSAGQFFHKSIRPHFQGIKIHK